MPPKKATSPTQPKMGAVQPSQKPAVTNQKVAAPNQKVALAAKLVSFIVQKGFKLVVFDFDNTVLKLHSFTERIQPDDVKKRNMQDDYADLDIFKALVTGLRKENIPVAVASYGFESVIVAYFQEVFKDVKNYIPFILSRDSDYSDVDGAPTKSDMLRKILEQKKDKTDPKTILFFDDDQKNIENVNENGYAAFHVGGGKGMSEDFWNNWYQAVAGSSEGNDSKDVKEK